MVETSCCLLEQRVVQTAVVLSSPFRSDRYTVHLAVAIKASSNLFVVILVDEVNGTISRL